jgi:hypothetical protein
MIDLRAFVQKLALLRPRRDGAELETVALRPLRRAAACLCRVRARAAALQPRVRQRAT